MMKIMILQQLLVTESIKSKLYMFIIRRCLQSRRTIRRKSNRTTTFLNFIFPGMQNFVLSNCNAHFAEPHRVGREYTQNDI